MDTKFSMTLHILVYIAESKNVVTSELLAKIVGANIREALLPIFEDSEKQLIMRLKSKTLKSLIDDMYKLHSAK